MTDHNNIQIGINNILLWLLILLIEKQKYFVVWHWSIAKCLWSNCTYELAVSLVYPLSLFLSHFFSLLFLNYETCNSVHLNKDLSSRITFNNLIILPNNRPSTVRHRKLIYLKQLQNNTIYNSNKQNTFNLL